MLLKTAVIIWLQLLKSAKVCLSLPASSTGFPKFGTWWDEAASTPVARDSLFWVNIPKIIDREQLGMRQYLFCYMFSHQAIWHSYIVCFPFHCKPIDSWSFFPKKKHFCSDLLKTFATRPHVFLSTSTML